MRKLIFAVLFIAGLSQLCAQPIEVQADYDAFGNCIFSAFNNTDAPLFLKLDFADLENTTFPEPLPYVKQLEPGFSDLFTLQRDPDSDVPRFNYDIKMYRSNPMAKIDLNFPYLIPFKPGTKVKAMDVQNIDGFWGNKGVKSWSATGFKANSGEAVFAARNGIVVEVARNSKEGDSNSWYHTWTNSFTLLQPDGTLICYRNVGDDSKKLKVGNKVYAGQKIGNIVNNANQLIVLIYHDSMHTKGLLFVIPQFVIQEGNQAIVNSSTEYNTVHPIAVRALELTKKERKKILGKK